MTTAATSSQDAKASPDSRRGPALIAIGAAFVVALFLLIDPNPLAQVRAMMVLPLLFGLAVAARRAVSARWLALAGTMINFLLSLRFLASYFAHAASSSDESTSMIVSTFDWLPQLGLSLSIGVDGVAALLIGLTGLLGPICVLGSWTAIKDRQRLFYGWLLVLQTAMVGVFAARDLLVFYVCFEFTLLPMFILINQFGSSDRRRAALKFFIYTFTGSIVSLVALIFLAVFTATRSGATFSLDIGVIAQTAHQLPAEAQAIVLLALMAGFAVKVPLFPVHTWLPLAHTEAPTAGSVVLAGVLLKLGTYAIYRLVLPLVPTACYEYAPAIAVLAIIGIVYAGLVCWVQRDIKKLVAYSSVSHLGFCVLGLFALNTAGLTGSILYMINHGLSTGALFLLIGFMYERYHTRSMDEVGGLAKKMPVWSTMMVFFTMASVGLPGLNGFISELLCTMGAFQSSSAYANGSLAGATFGNLGPWFAAFAATGMIIAAIYLLHMLAKIVWGELREPDGHARHEREPGALPKDLTAREILTLAPLAVLCLAFGLYPKPLIEAVEGPVNAQVREIQRHVEQGPQPPTPVAMAIESTDPASEVSR